jgi:hypothetical protein
LFSPQCRETTARDEDRGDARNARLPREDALREAAISLSLDEGLSFAGREYQLIELLWRTEP